MYVISRFKKCDLQPLAVEGPREDIHDQAKRKRKDSPVPQFQRKNSKRT